MALVFSFELLNIFFISRPFILYVICMGFVIVEGRMMTYSWYVIWSLLILILLAIIPNLNLFVCNMIYNERVMWGIWVKHIISFTRKIFGYTFPIYNIYSYSILSQFYWNKISICTKFLLRNHIEKEIFKIKPKNPSKASLLCPGHNYWNF